MRTVTCDRCGREIGPNVVPVVLFAGGSNNLHADLCRACLSIVRADLLAMVECWKGKGEAA